MKVCIVGASGKLGQYMVQHALNRGYEVVGVCREKSVGKLAAFGGRITIIPGATNDRQVIEKAVADLGAVWRLLEAQLEGRAFVAGDQFTMGDIPLGAAFYRYANLPIDRPSLPSTEAWYERLKAREAFRRHVMIPLT